MSEPFQSRRWIPIAALGVLLALNLGVWLLQPPAHLDRALPPPRVAYHLANRQGQEVALSVAERQTLAPAKIISRVYHPIQQTSLEVAEEQQTIWLNLIYAEQAGVLHNFYDSLVASGVKPAILETRVIPTRKGPLRTSLIQYQDPEGQSYYLLLWYQWQGGNAENRWRWYQEVLNRKIQRKPTVWQLVEVATPVNRNESTPADPSELKQLERFAASLYESLF